MRLPSIVFVLSESKRTALRFPLALTSGIVAAVSAMVAVDYNGDENYLVRLLMVAQIGMPLFISLTLLAERRGGARSPAVRWIHGLLGLFLLVVYYVTLPPDITTVSFTRFIQLNIGFHLLVAIMPYVGINDPNGFWQYNKTLFLRILSGLVFSATLYTGLVIAIAALDQLFGVDVGEEIYLRLWCGVIFIFNTWYFLGGVPTNLNQLSQRLDYPPILKIFSQYILAPLVAIYLVILLAYFFKIVVTTKWPSGWIGYLVSSVATVGLFSLVLLHPLVGQRENRWVNTYARLFYRGRLPALLMLLLAIYKRIEQYGVTENRYFLTVLTIWLAGVTLYGLFSKRRSVKVIPLTLCLVAFATSVGPWSAFGISKSSQTRRLTRLLQANELLVDGTLVPAQQDVTVEERREISAALDYLIDRHGLETVSPWFDDSLTSKIDSIPGYGPRKKKSHHEITPAIMTYLDVKYAPGPMRSSPFYYHFARETSAEPTDIGGYDVAHYYDIDVDGAEVFLVDGIEYKAVLTDGDTRMVISAAGLSAVEIPLTPVFDALRDRGSGSGGREGAPVDVMDAHVAGTSMNARLMILEISWNDGEHGLVLHLLKAVLLLDLPQ